MSEKNCPHCSSSIPADFASMPVCYICGGDLNAAPAAGSGWSSIDIKTNNARVCSSCKTEVKSILAMECPNCKAALPTPGQEVDIDKEKEKFESAVKSANNSSSSVSPIEEQIQTPESVVTSPQGNQISEPQTQLDKASEKKTNFVSNTSSSQVKPYPEREKEDFVSLKDKAKEKRKEGFFAKLLRMFGLKKD